MFHAQALLWLAGILLGYVYVGYPVVMYVWAALRPRARCTAPIEPSVSIVVVAHNEAPRIGARLDNLVGLQYPADRVEIILASDGSTDDTVDRSRAYEPAGVRVVACERRRGKPAVLNEVVPTATGEIVVLADARQRFEAGALRALVAHFADPRVGVVSGELVLLPAADATGVGEGIGFYWRYEKFIRQNESRASSTVGATGAIYAIRRVLFEAIPNDTILDDVLIPLRIVRRGYRAVFAPDARAFDQAVRTAREEFVRKVRTIAGNFQLFTRELWVFDPRQNDVWLQTVSHKALRLTIPLLHAAAVAANLCLTDVPAYRILLTAQALFYACAVTGCLHRGHSRKTAYLMLPYTMCLLLGATVIAFARFLTGRQHVTWEPASPH
jgi:cellulose synthase/poly-beta-1,6-N-acetylglucosamine synthase-like glycosyltransferase